MTLSPSDLGAVRSILSVPAHDPRKVARARERGADLLMWDLEASVPADAKLDALDATLAACLPGDAVRLNYPLRTEEIDALYPRQVVLVVPHVAAWTSDLRRLLQMGCRVIALFESAAGVNQADRIVHAAILNNTPFSGLAFGRWDFEAGVGFFCRGLVAHARAQVALVAHAAGLPCWDAPAPLDDPGDAEDSRAFGYTGKGCIHPQQIEIVHRAWAQASVDWHPLPFAASRALKEVVAT